MQVEKFQSLLNLKPKQAEDKIANYIEFLKNRNLSSSSLRNHFASIKKFYTRNRKSLNWSWLAEALPEKQTKHQDRIHTKEELQRILAKCDERKKVAFLLMISTGCRIGALPTLKVGDLEKIPEYGIYKVRIYAGSKEEYVTFCSPECATAIDTYFAYRRRYGEEVANASPVLRDQFNVLSPKEPRFIALGGMMQLLSRALEDSGLRTPRHGDGAKWQRHEVMRFHGLRKYYNTQMVKANVNVTIKEQLLGHSVGLDDNYHRPSEADLLKEYLKAIDLLTVGNEPVLERQVQTLKTENASIADLKVLVLQLQAKNAELTAKQESFSGMLELFKAFNEAHNKKMPPQVQEVIAKVTKAVNPQAS